MLTLAAILFTNSAPKGFTVEAVGTSQADLEDFQAKLDVPDENGLKRHLTVLTGFSAAEALDAHLAYQEGITHEDEFSAYVLALIQDGAPAQAPAA